jgi:hypothetical protein
MITIVAVILVVLLLGSLPTWPYSSGWGYYPSGGLGVILVTRLRLRPLNASDAARFEKTWRERSPETVG